MTNSRTTSDRDRDRDTNDAGGRVRSTRPNSAPAFYLQRPARVWQAALVRRSRGNLEG